MTNEEKHEQAKLLVKHVWNNDISAFKQDYEKIQKERIVDAVKEFKNAFVDAQAKKIIGTDTK